mgnify:CR=1 FL=1
MRRTRTQDYIKIELAKDLEMVVNDKRHLKRANKKDIPFLICTHISNRITNKRIKCMKLLSDYIYKYDGKAMPQDEYKKELERINSKTKL